MTKNEKLLVHTPETFQVIREDNVVDGQPYGYLVIHKVYPLYGVGTTEEEIRKDVYSLRLLILEWVMKKLVAYKRKEEEKCEKTKRAS